MMPKDFLSKLALLNFRRRSRERLVRNYFLIFVSLIAGGMIASGLFEIYFRYYETQEQIFQLQSEAAKGAINRIAQFILEIEGQMKSATLGLRLADRDARSANQFELKRLLYVAPAITDVVLLDKMGAAQLSESRVRAALLRENADHSKDGAFLQAKQGVTFLGTVYFRRGSDPYITVGVPVESYPGNVVGVLQAEVSLRFIWDIIRDLRVAKSGYGYIVTRSGDVIAHPNISLILPRRKADQLAQVKAALRPVPDIPRPESMVARGLTGEKVLSSYAYLPSLDWAVIVERPVSEAYHGLDASLLRTSTLLLIGVGIALLAAAYVARRVVRPLQQLSRGADRIASGDWDFRLDIKTGDEIEMLADRFNGMVSELKKSYQTLEDKVAQRTKELSALYHVTAASTRSLEIGPVLDEVVQKIAGIFAVDSTRIFIVDRQRECFRLVASFGVNPAGAIPSVFPIGRGILGQVAQSREPVIFENIETDQRYEKYSYTRASANTGFKFLAGFPINTTQECLGIITSMGQKPRALAPADVRLITAIADQIGIAIENIHLFDQVKARTAELESANRDLGESLQQQTTMAEILRVMAQTTSNLQTLLNSIVEGAVHLASANAGVIRLCDSELVPFAAHYRDGGSRLEELQKLTLHPDEESATTRAIRESSPVQILDIKNAGPNFRFPVEKTAARTVLAVPMLREKGAIGAIIIYRDRVGPFTERQVELVATFADQAVIAIENVRLFQKLQARTRELSALYDVTAIANQSLDLASVLEAVIKRFTETFGFDATRIYLVDPTRGSLRLHASFGSPPARRGSTVLSRWEGILGKVVEEGEPVIVGDLQTKRPHDKKSHPPANEKDEFGFKAFFPIKSKKKILGAVVCVNQQTRELSFDEFQLIQSVLEPIGVAIENLQLFEELKAKSDQLERTNLDLERASEQKSHFLANVSHELRTPLTVIKGSVDNMLDGLTGGFSEKQMRYLTRMRANLHRLTRFINDLLDLARIDSGFVELHPAHFGVVEVVSEVCDGLRPIAEQKQVQLDIRDPDAAMTAWGDRERVTQVLTNIIGNAIKFSPAQSKVIIAAEKYGNEAQISIRDTGPGIPPGDQDKIFDKYYQARNGHSANTGGMGLGLNIARTLVNMHRGRIWVESQVGQGSTFFFTLPDDPAPQTKIFLPG